MPRSRPAHPASTAALRGSPEVLAAATVLHELPPRLARKVRAIDAPSADAVTLKLRGGVRIVWGGTGQPAVKSKELAILMRGRARYFDVSDPLTAVTRDELTGSAELSPLPLVTHAPGALPAAAGPVRSTRSRHAGPLGARLVDPGGGRP